ncbi:hypothetical protein DFH06DRAFT_1261214 [Mycena polygramma]|nr:hypothetical protein DFH06DRAFT_1261214 [Mycena polygramma]
MGALMGGGVGLTIGFLFGSWSILQNGAGPRGAATFSFFLAIGSVIRNDSPILEAAHLQLMTPTPAIRSRSEGLQLMRARWEEERRRASAPRS